MKHRVYIYINGIRNDPSKQDAWTDEAVTYTHLHTLHKAEKFEYMTLATLRRIKQQERAEFLANKIEEYDGWDVYLVGHSNGCDIILRAMELIDTWNVHTIHLISGACEADPKRNYITRYMLTDRVQEVHLYIAGRDKAMIFAKLSQKLFGFLGLGYGTMGGLTQDEASELYGSANITYESEYGHSTWFDGKANFEKTMDLILSR